MGNTSRFRIGDYVRISNPSSKRFKRICEEFKGKVGKIMGGLTPNSYAVTFQGWDNEGCVYFFGEELEKISKIEYFMEML